MRTTTPKIGQAFAEWMNAKNEIDGEIHRAERPEGMPALSFSGAMSCSRQVGYKVAQLAPTDPMDGASLAITGMGRVLHEDIQAAIAAKWPQVTFEGQGLLRDLIWGYYDYDDPDADEIGEIKTVGAYKFDLANGYFRQGKAHVRPEGGAGPSVSHICQAGFNARAHGRANVRIIYLSREAVSVTKAEDMGIGPIDRFWAEWTFTEKDWGPLVDAETIRLEGIRALVASGILPDRFMYDDKTNKYSLADPDKHPLCRYCAQAHRCKMDGPGRIPVLLSKS